FVAAAGRPPESGRRDREAEPEPKRMDPFALHAVWTPRGGMSCAKIWGLPPSASIRFNSKPERKPMDRLSGDQNGFRASSVPGRGWPVVESSDRTHRREMPSTVAA